MGDRLSTILLVDDDDDVRVRLADGLARRLSCDVIHFRDPLEALGSSAGDRADLALLDIDMGEFTGLDLARALRRNHPALCIAFLTGSDVGSHGNALERIGPCAVLRKPAKLEEIARILSQRCLHA